MREIRAKDRRTAKKTKSRNRDTDISEDGREVNFDPTPNGIRDFNHLLGTRHPFTHTNTDVGYIDKVEAQKPNRNRFKIN